MTDRQIITDAEILWNYHHLNMEPLPAPLILVFGSHDKNVPVRAAELYLKGFGEKILFTGGFGKLTGGIETRPEAETFARIAVETGVCPEDILTETQSSDTQENIAFSKKLLAGRPELASRALVVDKPSRERRTFAALRAQWPELSFTITSPQYTFSEYRELYRRNKNYSFDELICLMAGDLDRIEKFPAPGLQIPQPVPQAVKEAQQRLAACGYGSDLLQGEGI